MIRFATIGTNFIVEWFLEAASRCDNLTYAVTYSRNLETAKAFAKRWGAAETATDLETLAADSCIDAVYIASPNALHFEQAMLFLSHGKHVLCEKPITTNLSELTCLIETAKTYDVVLLEAMRPAFDPGLKLIAEHLKELGTIRKVIFQYGKYSSRYDKFKQGIIENAFDPKLSNGALMDIGVYCVHPLIRLFGLPKDLIAHAVSLDNGLDGAGMIVAEYEGMQALLSYSKITNHYTENQIEGEDGCMVFDHMVAPRIITIHPNVGEPVTWKVDAEAENMVYEAREWARLIEENNIDHEYHHYSEMELTLMDEARKKMGIVFPADEYEQGGK